MPTIDEAIQDLEDILNLKKPFKEKNYNSALKLGSEALKRIKEDRRYSGIRSTKPLPGETKEGG